MATRPDRVDGELARPHLRYTELNRLRDELQRIAPRLLIAGQNPAAARCRSRSDQAARAAPAAGAPPSPAGGSQSPELNYHLGLLSAAEDGELEQSSYEYFLAKSRTSAGRTSPPPCFNRFRVSTPTIPGQMCRNIYRTLRTVFATWSPIGGPTRRIAATLPAPRLKPC